MKHWPRHLLAAGALVLGMGAAHAASDNDSKTLYFYNWTEYVPPGLLEQFTKAVSYTHLTLPTTPYV